MSDFDVSQRLNNFSSSFPMQPVTNDFWGADTTLSGQNPIFPSSFSAMQGFDTFGMNLSNPFGLDSGVPAGLNMSNFQGEFLNIDYSAMFAMIANAINQNMALANQYKTIDFSQFFGVPQLKYDNSDCASLKDVQYDKGKANQIANQVRKYAAGRTRGSGSCSKTVNDALYSINMGVTRAHAGDLVSSFSNSSKYKEVKISKADMKNLPGGIALVYPRGSAGYSSKYGHVEVTLGDGTAASDFVNRKPKWAPDMRAFVPV